MYNAKRMGVKTKVVETLGKEQFGKEQETFS
jgi:hypothetical protein